MTCGSIKCGEDGTPVCLSVYMNSTALIIWTNGQEPTGKLFYLLLGGRYTQWAGEVPGLNVGSAQA